MSPEKNTERANGDECGKRTHDDGDYEQYCFRMFNFATATVSMTPAGCAVWALFAFTMCSWEVSALCTHVCHIHA